MTCIQSWPKIKNVHVNVLNVKVICEKRLKFHERELFSFRLVFQITKKELLRIYEHLKLIVLVKLSLSFSDDVLENKTTKI